MSYGLNPGDLADLIRLAGRGRSAWRLGRDDARIFDSLVEHGGARITNVCLRDNLPQHVGLG